MAAAFEISSFHAPSFTQHSSPVRSSASSPPPILSGTSSPTFKPTPRRRDTSIFSPPSGVLTTGEINGAPMCDAHKETALMHYHRLLRVIDEDDPDAVPPYTSAAVARVQLARMTIVLRNTISHFRNPPRQDPPIRIEAPGPVYSRSDGKKLYQDPLDVLNDRDECVESLVHDLVDASFYIPESKTNLCADPLAPGHDESSSALVQESYAGGVDDFTELWTIPKMLLGAKPLPDYFPIPNIGAEVDVGGIYRRGKTESNVLYHARTPVVLLPQAEAKVPEQLKPEVDIQRCQTARVSVAWPPTGRSRAVSQRIEHLDLPVLRGRRSNL